jgi:flagellar FliJ protein
MLNIKMQMEDSLKNELGKATQKLEIEKNKLKLLEEDREESIIQIKAKFSQGVAVGKLREFSSYISLLAKKMEFQKENINYAQNNVDRYRRELIKVVQEKKILEKIKEKKYQNYLKEELMKEQQMNNEIISFSFNKNLAGEKNG